METLLQLHQVLSRTTWLFFLFLGVWGVWRGLRGRTVDGSYMGALVIGQGVYLVQAIIGTILFIGGGRPIRAEIHLLYGAFAIVFLPFVYLVWLRGDDSNRAQWVLAFCTLFLFGIALRAISTGV